MSRRKISIDKNYDDDSDDAIESSKVDLGDRKSPSRPPSKSFEEARPIGGGGHSADSEPWGSQRKPSEVGGGADSKQAEADDSLSRGQDSSSWKEAKPVHNFVYTKDKDEEDDDNDDKTTSELSSRSSRSIQDYFENAEKDGLVLPRRSGRYYDEGASSDPNDGDAKAAEKPSFNMVAHPKGVNTLLVQCVIIRKRSYGNMDMFPTYELRLESPSGDHQFLLVAIKQSMNKTSNYHFFDMTRGTVGQIFNKKSGNYIGKLRSISLSRLDFYLVGNNETVKEEYAGIAFEQESIISMSGGPKPRRVEVLIPKLNSDGTPMPYKPSGRSSKLTHEGVHMCELLRSSNSSILKPSFHIFQNKEPEKNPETGSYNLNFKGRVSAPSVKNFQLVSSDDVRDIVLQFGKVNDDRFHLDFKAPFNAFQAFALAICQFDL